MPLLIEFAFIAIVIVIAIIISSNKERRAINSIKNAIEDRIDTVEDLKKVKKLRKTLEQKKKELEKTE
jgi:CO dehydrogenase/acetyl-CoA synthase beta subunit